MITIFRADALMLQLVQHAVAVGRTGSRVPSASLAAAALRNIKTPGLIQGSIFNIAVEVFANWPATVRYTDIDVVFSNDVVIGSEGSPLTIGLSDVLVRADDMSSALALAVFDGRLLVDIAVHDDATRSVLVVNKLSGVESVVASLAADIARQISDAASSSFAHLVSRLAAHEKSEQLVEVIDQTVLPRVHVDGLNSHALQLLERDVAARLVRNIDNTSFRHAAFMLALRSGLCSGDLKVVPGYESVTVDIDRNYSSSMFIFGVQDTSGNEAVDLKVEGPDYDYEQPRVWLETRKIHGCVGKRELGLAWLLKSYGDRLLAAFTADTHECAEAMPYAQVRSRTWDVIDAHMFLLMKSMLEHQESVAVAIGNQTSALSTAASALQQVASVAVPPPPSRVF